MSAAELEIFDNMGRFQQVMYLINAQTAITRAEANYPGSGLHNGNGDAFRHAYFSALNTKDLGTILAKMLGDAHENRPNLSPNEQLEVLMDLRNNQIGITTAGNSNFSESTIINLTNNGGLWIIQNGILIPSHL